MLSVMNRKITPNASIVAKKEEEVDDLRSWLLLLLLPQSGKTNTGNLDDLEADTWNISLGLALATETGKQDLVVLVDEVQATIVWNCSSLVLVPCVVSTSLCMRGFYDCNIPKAVTFFPFLMSWTRTHFLMAELGCLASTPTFSRTMPLAWEDPPNGEDLNAVPRARFL